MKTNKTKLTPKLLSEIVGVEVIDIDDIFENKLVYTVSVGGEEVQTSRNVDTLTREMKKWCLKQEIINVFELTSYLTHSLVTLNPKFSGSCLFETRSRESDFQAVLDATLYVYKIKGVSDE
jgi:alpha-glucuronidase